MEGRFGFCDTSEPNENLAATNLGKGAKPTQSKKKRKGKVGCSDCGHANNLWVVPISRKRKITFGLLNLALLTKS